ncbi:MAG: hypothetical protein M3478_06660, partial [Planctomycetota bacterium]|nr:hypothetical protein [Planctomycetota bacterium]
VQGMVTKDDVFHIDTYENANYTAVNWLWEANFSQLGDVQNFPWARWVSNENAMPSAQAETSRIKNLVGLQLGDEWDLNDVNTRNRSVNWFNAIRDQYPNTILSMNNWGGQVADGPLIDFVTRAKPDMISFDEYPWKSDYNNRSVALPARGSPTSWYGELRRYRDISKSAAVPFGVYRQTFKAVQDYDSTVYRVPSKSEMSLSTHGALAFGAKYLMDFTYNTGASTLFTTPGGDTNPTPAYAHQAKLNKQAQNLGKALVRLQSIDDLRRKANPTDPSSPALSDDPNFPNGYTTNVLFLRGSYGTGAPTERNPLPVNFHPDPQAPNSWSWWEFNKNDPFLSGWGRSNLGTVNNGQVGDVVISWLKPIDASLDNPTDRSDQLYLMVVNGITSPDDTADTRQTVNLDFEKLNFPGLMQLNPDTGLVEPATVVTFNGKWRLSLTLEGGHSALLKFGNDPNTFIHVVPEPACLSLLPLVGLLLRRTR